MLFDDRRIDDGPVPVEGFSDRLKHAMARAKVSRAAFADVMGVSTVTVDNWTNKNRPPETWRWRKMASLLEVNLGWLIFGDGYGRDETVSDKEMNIIAKLRRLSEIDRARVDAYIDGLLAASEGGSPAMPRPPGRVRQ